MATLRTTLRATPLGLSSGFETKDRFHWTTAHDSTEVPVLPDYKPGLLSPSGSATNGGRPFISSQNNRRLNKTVGVDTTAAAFCTTHNLPVIPTPPKELLGRQWFGLWLHPSNILEENGLDCGNSELFSTNHLHNPYPSNDTNSIQKSSLKDNGLGYSAKGKKLGKGSMRCTKNGGLHPMLSWPLVRPTPWTEKVIKRSTLV